MAIFARVLDKKLAGDGGMKQVSEEEYKEFVRGDESHQVHVLQCFQTTRGFGYDGGDADTVYPKNINAEGLMTSYEEYVKQEDWSSLDNRETLW